MLTLPHGVRIYVARGPTDMRKAIDGLAAVTREYLRRDPCTGHLFVFCNRRRNRLKILYWEESGFWLLHKRLERGTFNWPGLIDKKDRDVTVSHGELTALLGGLDIYRRRRRFSPKVAKKLSPSKLRGA